MYNGIGLPTPRGSGTNGHVQRNWALIKSIDKSKSYRSEAELVVFDLASNKQPNKEILDHKKKRKIELKCAEFADILEEQGYNDEVIQNKVGNYRSMLMSHESNDTVNQEGKQRVTETHQLAEAQQEKNSRLRKAFGISEYFIDGSSFNPNRQAKEQIAKQEVEKEGTLKFGKEDEIRNQQATKYELVHTPSPEPLDNKNTRSEKRKKRKLSTSSEEIRKKKKVKKRKRDRSGKSKDKRRRKRKQSSSSSDSTDKWNSNFVKSDDSSCSDERRKRRGKKEKRKPVKKKRSTTDSSRERYERKSRSRSPKKLRPKFKKDISSKITIDLHEKCGDSKKPKSKYTNKIKSVVRSREKSFERNIDIATSGEKARNKEKFSEETEYSRNTLTEERRQAPKMSHKKYDSKRNNGKKERKKTPDTNTNRNSKYIKREHVSYTSIDKGSHGNIKNVSRDLLSDTRRKNRNNLQQDANIGSTLSWKDISLKPLKEKMCAEYSLADKLHSEWLEKSHQIQQQFKSGENQIYHNATIENQEKKHPSFTEKHHNIIEKEKHHYKESLNYKQPMPIVRLRSSSESRSSEDDCNIDEEYEKELRMLRLLKSGLAAKAKECIEKKIPKTFPDPISSISLSALTTSHGEESLRSSTTDNKNTPTESNVFDIKMLSLKNEKSPSLNVRIHSKTNTCESDDNCHDGQENVLNTSKQISSRSRSKSKSKSKSRERKSRSRSSSVSSCSSHHRSSRSRTSTFSSSKSSRSMSRSRSRSTSRSGTSSRTSSSASRSRSPSIPRRHGSPSFLDRRRITSNT